MDELELSSMLDAGMSLEKIGETVGRHPSTVSYWLAKYG
jgi:IS30 family transposase